MIVKEGSLMRGDMPDPVPLVGVDLERPGIARVYDYFLGGTTHWAIDREFGDRLLEAFPTARNIAIANRLFLSRAVRHLTKRGAIQFLDIGAGAPTVGNTHEVADELANAEGRRPDTRVVYVDNEPVAVAHAEVLLDKHGDPNRHAVIAADLRDPDGVWEQALETELLDPDAPVALLLVAVLHLHQPSPEGADVGAESVARFRELLPPGSFIAISHLTDDGIPPEVMGQLEKARYLIDSSSNSLIFRSRAEIATLLDGWTMLEPGWVWTPEWHPEECGPKARTITFPSPNHALLQSGVGQKP